MVVCSLLSLGALGCICTIQSVPPQAGQRKPFWRIMHVIASQGPIVSLQCVGFAELGAFFALYTGAKGWAHTQCGHQRS